jgi:hypothetical protein
VAERLVQLMPLGDTKTVAYHAPTLAEYRGGEELPLMAFEPVLAFGLFEDGSERWAEAMVLDNDDGELMRVSELAGFLCVAGDDGRLAAETLAARITGLRKRYPATNLVQGPGPGA